jgi:hypothetical protein
VAGTARATGYSLAENGASIVFTVKFQPRLFKVPIGGGTPSPDPATSPPDTSTQLVGVSCKGSTCVVAKDKISVFYSSESIQSFAHFFDIGSPMELHRISLADGTDQLLLTNGTNLIYATPQISPISGDVVFQRGGVWGHLQTFATPGISNGVLHLLKGAVP